MKRTALMLGTLLLTFCMACGPQADKADTDEACPDPLEGVWKLSTVYLTNNGDTLLWGPDEIPEYYKVYMDGYVILGCETPYDTTAWNGFGNYTLSGSSLTESYSFMSLEMKVNMGGETGTDYEIILKDDFCKQTSNTLRRGVPHLRVEEWKKLNQP